MVQQYVKGSHNTQCQLVKWGKGKTSCPNAGDVLALSGTQTALRLGGVASTRTARSAYLTFARIKDQINAGRPIVHSWVNQTEGGGHVGVIRGFYHESTVNFTQKLVYWTDPEGGVLKYGEWDAFKETKKKVSDVDIYDIRKA
jgi:hypothetical protein